MKIDMLSVCALSSRISAQATFAASRTRRVRMISGMRAGAPLCAPSTNLNNSFIHFPTAAELYAHIRGISKSEDKEFVVRNFVGVIEDISIKASTVETELFPLGALEYYTKKNMGWEYTPYAFLPLCT